MIQFIGTIGLGSMWAMFVCMFLGLHGKALFGALFGGGLVILLTMAVITGIIERRNGDNGVMF